MDALNSNAYLLTGGTALAQNTNIDTITTPGNYGTHSSDVARTMSGLPFAAGSSNIFAFNLKVEHAAFYQEGIVRQTLRFFNDRYAYIRQKLGSNASWSTWEKVPTRGEVDALNNRHTISAVGTTTTFTVPNSYRGILYVTDSSPDRCGEYAVFCTGAGAVGYKTLYEAAAITIDTSIANKLTLTPASGTRMCMFLNVDKVITV